MFNFGLKDKIKKYGNGLYEKLIANDNQPLEAIQLDMETGEIDPVKSLELQQRSNPLTLKDLAFGRTYTMDTQQTDPLTGESKLTTTTNLRPGFLSDFDAGMKENYNTPFEIGNLSPRRKGFAHKLGEVLGSTTRLLSGFGGDAFIAGQQGLEPALKRANIRTNNQLYKNVLKDNYGFTDEDLTGAVIDNNTFKNISNSYNNLQKNRIRIDIARAKDNTARARLILDGVKNGSITPEEAQFQMLQYGLTFNDLQESNNTRQTNSQIQFNTIKGNVAQQNADANTTRANAYADYMENRGQKNNMVMIEAPDGTRQRVPQEQAEYYINKGGKVIK